MTPRYFALETKSIAEPSSLTAAQGLLYLLPKRNTAHFLALKLIIDFRSFLHTDINHFHNGWSWCLEWPYLRSGFNPINYNNFMYPCLCCSLHWFSSIYANEVKMAERNVVQDMDMLIRNSYVMYQKVTLPVILNDVWRSLQLQKPLEYQYVGYLLCPRSP